MYLLDTDSVTNGFDTDAHSLTFERELKQSHSRISMSA